MNNASSEENRSASAVETHLDTNDAMAGPDAEQTAIAEAVASSVGGSTEPSTERTTTRSNESIPSPAADDDDAAPDAEQDSVAEAVKAATAEDITVERQTP